MHFMFTSSSISKAALALISQAAKFRMSCNFIVNKIGNVSRALTFMARSLLLFRNCQFETIFKNRLKIPVL